MITESTTDKATTSRSNRTRQLCIFGRQDVRGVLAPKINLIAGGKADIPKLLFGKRHRRANVGPGSSTLTSRTGQTAGRCICRQEQGLRNVKLCRCFFNTRYSSCNVVICGERVFDERLSVPANQTIATNPERDHAIARFGLPFS